MGLIRGVKKHGTPLERFRRRVRVDTSTGCWLWLGGTNKPDGKGYGQIYVRGRKVMVHVFAYTTFVGPIPPGKEIDHKCRTRTCVNPEHLEPVTHAENVRRGAETTKQRCPRGHLLSGNALGTTGQARHCKACIRQARKSGGAGRW